MDADARKEELQLREDRIGLKEAELASLEQSTKAGLKTAQKKVPCHPLILLWSRMPLTTNMSFVVTASSVARF